MVQKITHYVCARKGYLHYSATPDLAISRCPICDSPVVGEVNEVSEPEPKTLLDLLYEADAIEIDGIFCRHFHMEYDLDEDEEPDASVLDIDIEVDGCNYEWYFTAEELRSAKKYPESTGYMVLYRMSTISIVPYKVNEVKA